MDDSILAKVPDDDCVLGPSSLGNLPTMKVAVAAGVVGFVAGRLPTVAAAGVVGFVVGFVAGRGSRPAKIVSTSDAPVATLEADPALSVESALGPFLGKLPPEILDAVVQKLGWFQTTFAMAGKTCREAVERVASTRAVLAADGFVLTQAGLERLRSRGMTPLAVAAMEADVEALEWLIQLFDGKGLKWRDVGIGTGLSRLAAGRGKIESLTCLRANGCPWDWGTCSSAARGGHLEMLQWARQNGCPWEKWTCAEAALKGHLEVLQWALENGCPWNAGTCSAAARGGHLEVLQWARENGCPWNEYTCSDAARGGHLEVLQWAHQNGCPWDKRTCSAAAVEGHLEMLQWARENGCPWDEYTWRWADPSCRPFLIEHGCPGAR